MLTIRRGGTAVDPTVLRSFPGTRATLVGRLVLARSAAYTVISNLRLVGLERGHACAKMCPSPTVNADHTTFVNDEVTNHHADATCFLLGDANGVFGRADYTTISDSRIHDCGALPPTDLDHGIYVEASSGTRIFRNLIYGNADRGIQLYPDADHTRIAGNVIDGNGQGVDFGARGAQTTDDNLVEYNVVSNARVSYNVLSAYGPGDKVGDGNIVANNCIGGGRASAWGPGGISRNHLGFWLRGNLLTVPRFRNARHGNFQLVKGRRCQRLLAAGDG